MEMVGDFGEMKFTNSISGAEQVLTFKASKILFKMRPEHVVLDTEYEMELEVYHKGDDGSQAVVSFMFDSDSRMAMDNESRDDFNPFLDQMSPNAWRRETGFSQ